MRWFLAVILAGAFIAPLSAQGLVLPPMTRSEAAEGHPCCVTGVVTMASSWRLNSCVLADVADPDGPAVYVSGETFQKVDSVLEGMDALAVGQIVEVTGETAKFSFAPGVKARHFRLVGHMSLPSPREGRLRDFDRGRRDNERVTLAGVLVEARAGRFGNEEAIKSDFAQLLVSTPDGLFVAHVPGVPERWRSLVDAELRLKGCAMTFFNIRAEYIGLHLEVAAPEDVEVLSPPPSAFALPVTPLDEILAPTVGLAGCHRKRVCGTVTYSRSGEFFYIQSGEMALKVRTRETMPLLPGDEVEAIGFALMQDNMGEMRAALYRPTGRKLDVPAPEAVMPKYLDELPVYTDGSFINFDGRAISVEGCWVRSESTADETVAYVMVGRRMVRVHAPRTVFDGASDFGDWDSFRPNVRVTGVCVLTVETGLPDGRVPRLNDVALYADGLPGRGVEPIRDGVWAAHMRRRFVRRLAAVALAAVGFVLFVLTVRWRKAHGESRRLAAIIAERKRMAGDLHDSIEQHLTGARMLLASAVKLNPATPEGVKNAVATANSILAQAKTEIRETVWNLRSDELFEEPPDVVLRNLATRVSSTGAARVRTLLRGLPGRLDRHRFADIVFIVQEAITNAIKHGRAKNIVIVADPLQAVSGDAISAAGFVLRVVNDGETFDASGALGPEAGHFGLAGMRERAVRSGLEIGFENTAERVVLRMEVRL